MMRMGVREARARFSDLLGRVYYGKEVVIIERAGKPVAVMIPIDLYERWLHERKARFQALERIRKDTGSGRVADI